MYEGKNEENTVSKEINEWIIGGVRFGTFIDNYSGFTFIILLALKSEVEETMEQFVVLCENKFGRKPKITRCDRGGEYTYHIG